MSIVSKWAFNGCRFITHRKLTNGCSVVISSDVLPRTGYCQGVEDFKEIKIQHIQEFCGGTFFGIVFTPRVECLLRLPENLLYAAICIQLIVNLCRLSFISECQLVLQV